jgi:hypothetical protein
LLLVGGPSGCGKTTTMHLAMARCQSVVHFDVDLLWGLSERFDSPGDDYSELSGTRLRFAWSLMQSGRPVVLWGAGTPEQTEQRPERALFSDVHYLSLVCDEDELVTRLRSRDDFHTYDTTFLARTRDYVRYLRDPERNTRSHVIDSTCLEPEAVADAVGEWIGSRITASCARV